MSSGNRVGDMQQIASGRRSCEMTSRALVTFGGTLRASESSRGRCGCGVIEPAALGMAEKRLAGPPDLWPPAAGHRRRGTHPQCRDRLVRIVALGGVAVFLATMPSSSPSASASCVTRCRRLSRRARLPHATVAMNDRSMTRAGRTRSDPLPEHASFLCRFTVPASTSSHLSIQNVDLQAHSGRQAVPPARRKRGGDFRRCLERHAWLTRRRII